MTVHGMLAATAAARPHAPALTHGDETWTYAQLAAAAARVRRFLLSRGVAPGDRVALLMENGLPYAAAFFGALEAGACVVALNHQNPPSSHAALLRDSGATVLLTRAGQARRLPEIVGDGASLRCVASDRGNPSWELPCELVLGDDAVDGPDAPPADVGPDDLALILYTSGSTGTPRGVTLTHGNLTANTEQILAYLELTPDDSVLCVLPFHYSFGNSLLLTHVRCGGRVVVDNRFAFPQKVLETLEQERCTGFSGVPSHYAILATRTDFLTRRWPGLRYLTQAGGAMAPALTRRIHAALPADVRLFVMYGQTEGSARLSWLPPEALPEKIGSIGRGIPGVSLTVRRADGSECGVDEVGELVASGPNIMRGYWNDPEETARVLHADGLHTGDLARRDADGFLFIVDRVKNMIKAGANRVSPRQIEDVILELPEVAEAAVIGVPDELLGEAIVACLVPAPGAVVEPKAVLRHCQQHLAAFKLPRDVHLLDALPRNAAGKTDAAALRTRFGPGD
ncbi:MAG TPA: class I adenylate-forming enzyme family protein [Candidatus Krumholzibacteria bacterium]|nr:class I adenylate-forming enzyme family protein [Candidatus Krumholzibacteria bacterium]HRX51461.1 class I adenylate-forming enzyme family protein [Candidatus Krumholzibacteria bacterium]